MSKIINTRADLDALAGSDPAAHAAFVQKLKGALKQTTNLRVYPEGYNHALDQRQAGYLAPQFADVDTSMPAQRFGFTRGQLLSL